MRLFRYPADNRNVTTFNKQFFFVKKIIENTIIMENTKKIQNCFKIDVQGMYMFFVIDVKKGEGKNSLHFFLFLPTSITI